MIRLLLLPLAYLAHRTIRVYRTPWCSIVDHHVIQDTDGLKCRRCGQLLNRH
jgi:ribosomal protein L34E